MRRLFAFLFRHEWEYSPQTEDRNIGTFWRFECQQCGKLSIWHRLCDVGVASAILRMKGCTGKVSK